MCIRFVNWYFLQWLNKWFVTRGPFSEVCSYLDIFKYFISSTFNWIPQDEPSFGCISSLIPWEMRMLSTLVGILVVMLFASGVWSGDWNGQTLTKAHFTSSVSQNFYYHSHRSSFKLHSGHTYFHSYKLKCQVFKSKTYC